MGRQLLAGTLTMNALLVLSIFISQSLGQASAECPEPTIGNCSATDYRCDLGFTAGCWMGSFCMPEGSICPMICNTPAPSNFQLGKLSVTWAHMMDVGRETTACHRAQSVLMCATTPCHPNARRGNLPATWDTTMVAGLE